METPIRYIRTDRWPDLLEAIQDLDRSSFGPESLLWSATAKGAYRHTHFLLVFLRPLSSDSRFAEISSYTDYGDLLLGLAAGSLGLADSLVSFADLLYSDFWMDDQGFVHVVWSDRTSNA